MIKIDRADCPNALKNSRAKVAYKHKKVVSTLWEMQNKKCCYCECKIPEKGHMKAVEHFQPQSIYKDRVNDWPNLLLACAQCNGKKSDKFPIELTDKDSEPKVLYIKKQSNAQTLLIDPTEDNGDPEDHLDFNIELGEFLGLIKPRNNDPKGRETIDVIGLSDQHYTHENARHIFNLQRCHIILLGAKMDNDEDLINLCLLEFESYFSPSHKHTAVARVYIKHHNIHNEFQNPVN